VVIAAQQPPEQSPAHEAAHVTAHPVVSTAPALRLRGRLWVVLRGIFRRADESQESIERNHVRYASAEMRSGFSEDRSGG
jgi:hypothetical protein